MKKFFTLSLFLIVSLLAKSQATHVTISQIYGGGGNTGALFNNDYVELYNPTNSPIDISNWQIAYASATGTSWTNKTRIPAGSIIQAKKYFLIQEGAGTNTPAALPTPDLAPTVAQGVINMSGTAGKVALVSDTTTLAVSTTPTPVVNATTSLTGSVIDFVGFGTTVTTFEGAAAPAPSNSTAIFRAGDGSVDTDNNSADFTAGAPNPRNSSFVVPVALTSFNASLINNQASLVWNTANEVNVNGYSIEKSNNGKDFNAIGFIAAKNASAANYSFNDVLADGVNYYRLKISGKDASIKYSSIVAINNKQSTKLEVYPNPVTNTATLTHEVATTKATIKVVTVDGKNVYTQNLQVGATQTSFDVSKLLKGNYVVVFENGTTRTSLQFVKQ